MRILFLSHYFPPEVNAPASRTYEHCVRWVQAGHEVTVVTCVPNCPTGIVQPGYRNRFWPQFEIVDGIRVVRIWTLLAPNAGMLRRTLNFVSYLISAVLTAIWLRRPDVLVATSPQFFCGWAGTIVSFLRRIPFTLEIRDIWPEGILVNNAIRKGLLLRILERMEIWMYRSADRIVTVGNSYRRRILAKVDIPDRVAVVTNGVDLKKFVPAEPDPKFREEWGLDGKFVCSYIGTIGMSQGLTVVNQAAKILRDKGRTEICFLLVGEGAERKMLEDQAREWNLEGMVIFTGILPKQQMPVALASSDACLIHLKKSDFYEGVIPSKLFETMAMERPIIMGVKGDARDIVKLASAGLDMEPSSPESLVECVESLADHPEKTRSLGLSARKVVTEQFSRDVLAERMLAQLLETVAARNQPGGVVTSASSSESTAASETQMASTESE